MRAIIAGLAFMSVLFVYGTAAAEETAGHETMKRIHPVGQVNITTAQNPSAATTPETPSSSPAPASPSQESQNPAVPPQPSDAKPMQIAAETEEKPAVDKDSKAGEEEEGEGEKVYDKTCKICHAAGVAGAPKLGDKAAWSPRAEQGLTVLLEHVEKGYKAMPPKGTCVDCSNDDLKAAIEFMLSKADVKVQEK